MTIFWAQWGPLVKYSNGFLDIRDLNPEIHTRWRLSRSERFRFGLRMILSAFRT